MIDIDKLTKDNILEDSVFAELLDEESEVTKAKLEIQLRNKADTFGLKKDFNNILKAFKIENEKVNRGLIPNIVEGDNSYWNSKNQKITDFTLKVVRFVNCIDDDSLSYHEVEITTSTGSKIIREFGPLSMINIDAFKKALNTNYCTFSGSQSDLDNIKKLIFSMPYPTEKVVSLAGYREIDGKKVFIEGNKCLIGNEVSEEYTTVKKHGGILSSILDYQPITSKELKALSEHLFSFNSESITYAIVGYSIACLLRPKLSQIHKKTPHLLVIGEAGSGKSETVDNILCGLLGINDVCSAGGITKFGLDKKLSSNTSLPLILNEYKPYMMSKSRVNLISEAIRNSYDGYVSGRGNKQGELQECKLSTGIVLVGEAGTNETAVLDRSILVTLSKKESMQPSHTASYRWLVENKILLTKLTRKLLVKIVDLDQEELRKIFSKSEKLISDQITSTRTKDCLAACITGLMILNLLMKDININAAAAYMSANYIEESEGGSNKSIIDITLEEINNAFPKLKKQLRDDPYQIIESIKEGKELAVRINTLYPELTKYSKAYDTGFVALNQREFIRQLKKCEYFVEYKSVKFHLKDEKDEDFPDNLTKIKPIKAYCFDVEKLKAANINIDNFIEEC